MKHDLYDRDDGLAHCKVCNGGEASLPLDCPGRRMTAHEQDEVRAERLNYVGRSWWRAIDAKVASEVAAERERCARMCESEGAYSDEQEMALRCAAAIREG